MGEITLNRCSRRYFYYNYLKESLIKVLYLFPKRFLRITKFSLFRITVRVLLKRKKSCNPANFFFPEKQKKQNGQKPEPGTDLKVGVNAPVPSSPG